MTVKHYPVNDTELDGLADKMLEMDAAGQWSDYTQYDLSNALLVLNRVAGAILFKQSMDGGLSLSAACDLAEKYGAGLRMLTKEAIGIDPAETMKDMKALREERTPQ